MSTEGDATVFLVSGSIAAAVTVPSAVVDAKVDVSTVVRLVGVRVRVLLDPDLNEIVNVSKGGMAVVVTLEVQMTDDEVRVSHTM